jgi:Dolichyl-phosphate-mannose-protein mannosyltransferase
MTGAIPAGEFVVGCVFLALIVGAAAGVATVVVRRRLDHLTGSPRLVAAAMLTLAALIVEHLVPLALGVLSRGTVLVAAAVLVLASRLVPAVTAEPRDQPPPPSQPSGIGSWALAGVGALATVAYTLTFLRTHATVPLTSVDALGFHLPGVFRYIQSGTLWQTTQYLADQAHGNYPQNGDLLLLAGVLPWRSAALVRFVDPVLLAVAALSAYAIARELRAPPPAAVLVACAAAVLGPALLPALDLAMTDSTFLAGLGAGTLFLVRHWRTGRSSELVLAGVGLGIAFGTKWYGLPDVPGILAIWALATLLARRPPRRLLRDGGILVGTIALFGGFWLLRNLVLTGDPVFDYKVTLFGATLFDAPPDLVRQRVGFSLAHYVGDLDVLRKYVFPVFRKDFGLVGGGLAAGALTAGVLSAVAWRRRRPAFDARIPMLVCAALVLAGAYLVTPYSAMGLRGAPILVTSNTRYGVPALLLAAPVTAWAMGQLGRARIVAEAALLVAVVVALRDHLAPGTGQVAKTVLLVLALATVCGGMVAAARTGGTRWRGVAAALALAAVCGAGALGYHYQRVLARTPYTPDDPAVAYVLTHAPAHTRIGLTGAWTARGLVPVAPLFGPRLRNEVDYVGPFVRHMRREYRTRSEFVAALRRGGYPLLVVGTGFPPVPRPHEELWARAAGYVPVTRSARLILLRRST